MPSMQPKYLPEYVDPNRLAEQQLLLEGVVDVAAMGRLSGSLHTKTAKAEVKLQFGMDEQRIPFVRGSVATSLILQCQRCLEPYQYDIMSDFLLAIVGTMQQAKDLPDHYDPVLTKQGQLALRELIEDELILALPIIPKHEPDTCKTTELTREAGWGHEKTSNPFHVLESFKKQQEKIEGS